MSKMDRIEERLTAVNELANEVAKKANDELSIAKHKITCLTLLVVLFAIIGAFIALHSIHTMEELFYNMSVEEEYVEYDNDIKQTNKNIYIGE
jgi:hypothetical protein